MKLASFYHHFHKIGKKKNTSEVEKVGDLKKSAYPSLTGVDANTCRIQESHALKRGFRWDYKVDCSQLNFKNGNSWKFVWLITTVMSGAVKESWSPYQ